MSNLPCVHSVQMLNAPISLSTPLHQILTYALADKSNKTKFTLIYSNVSEKDILLREEFDDLKKKFPDTFNVIYFVDKAEKGWTGVLD